jgi:hypothetical protein
MSNIKLDLELGEIFCTYPDGIGSLMYEVDHPFLFCSGCEDYPCVCGDDVSHQGDTWTCKLCKCHNMTERALKYHLSEPAHERRMAQAARQQDEAKEIIYLWNHINDHGELKRLKGEDSRSLPDNVLAEAFRFMKASKHLDRRLHIAKAAELLSKYENAERLSLLYLAVWKEECLAQMPAVHTIASARQWMTAGWKEHKAEQRSSSAMNVVASLIQPFLG